MNQTTLQAQVRQKTGKGIARRLRNEKQIPAVLYGPHVETPLTIAVDPKSLRAAMQTEHRLNTILTLELDGGETRTALLKDYQQDPVTRELLHADFYEVQADKALTVPVPVVLKGRAKGVVDGGVLTQNRRLVDVVCLPKDIPASIEVDVTNMGFNEVIHVADIQAPAGVKISFLNNFTIAVLSAPEAEEKTPAEAAQEAAKK